MKIAAMNWMQVEEYLSRDDRGVLPIGSVEQHAYLSLATDAILAERVASEAAEPLGIPVFPAMAYGITPTFRGYPGTICLRIETLIAVVRDALATLSDQGFRRILIVNGHGGNSAIRSFCSEWTSSHPGLRVRFHDWWNAPRVWKVVQEIDPQSSHASWMESFPWTRVADAGTPDGRKPMLDPVTLQGRDAASIRSLLGDGCYGGLYRRPEADTERLWRTAIEETRGLMTDGWA